MDNGLGGMVLRYHELPSAQIPPDRVRERNQRNQILQVRSIQEHCKALNETRQVAWRLLRLHNELQNIHVQETVQYANYEEACKGRFRKLQLDTHVDGCLVR